jgi:hypothetical protein
MIGTAGSGQHCRPRPSPRQRKPPETQREGPQSKRVAADVFRAQATMASPKDSARHSPARTTLSNINRLSGESHGAVDPTPTCTRVAPGPRLWMYIVVGAPARASLTREANDSAMAAQRRVRTAEFREQKARQARPRESPAPEPSKTSGRLTEAGRTIPAVGALLTGALRRRASFPRPTNVTPRPWAAFASIDTSTSENQICPRSSLAARTVGSANNARYVALTNTRSLARQTRLRLLFARQELRVPAAARPNVFHGDDVKLTASEMSEMLTVAEEMFSKLFAQAPTRAQV